MIGHQIHLTISVSCVLTKHVVLYKNICLFPLAKSKKTNQQLKLSDQMTEHMLSQKSNLDQLQKEKKTKKHATVIIHDSHHYYSCLSFVS